MYSAGIPLPQTAFSNIYRSTFSGKGKIHPMSGHEGPDVE
jgi:hypothetical protein